MKRILLTVCLAGTTACASMTGAGSMPELPPNATGTVVGVAAQDGRFATLLTALKAAELLEPLTAEGPFTIFAPTDEAFQALKAGTLDGLLKPESKDNLVKLLRHHVVSGKLMAEDAPGLSDAITLAGTTLAIETADGSVKIGGANVTQADIAGSNGIIHVVDRVIVPADM